MVKKARNKKRRAGRIGKTKLKNRNYQFFKPPRITDPVIKSTWDPKISPALNMAKIGLSSEPIARKKENVEISSSYKSVELYDIPESDIIPKSSLSQRMLPVSIENQKYMVKLFEKHGNDYEKMARDIKVNFMQHTPAYLRKIGARFCLLSEGEIRVEIPEDVKKFLQSA